MSPARQARPAASGTASALVALALGFLPSTAAADWLVTTEGEVIETAGPWQVQGTRVVFRPPGGAETSIRATEIDLPASRAYTQVVVAAPHLPRGWTVIGPPRPGSTPADVLQWLRENDVIATFSQPRELPPEVKARHRDLTEVEDEERPEKHTAPKLFGRPLIVSGGYDLVAFLDGDLRPADPRDEERSTLRQSLELELYYQVRPKVSLFLESDLMYRSELSSQSESQAIEDLNVRASEAWLHFADIGVSGLDLQVGRQTMRDPRGWWWSGQLDALRLQYENRRVELQLAVAQDFAPLDLERRELDPDEEDILRALGSLAWRYRRHHSLGLFSLAQRDRSSRFEAGTFQPVVERDESDADLDWLGVRFTGRRRKPEGLSLQYWAEGALVRGDETLLELASAGPELRLVRAVHQRDVAGEAMDLGVSLTGPWLGKPTLTLSFAAGSGGPPSEDDELDRSFRQTHLHSNVGRFQGVNGFRYYGELLDPELSNLEIWTAGLGFRFLGSNSLEVVGHSYRQDEPAPFLRRTRLRSRPDGVSDAIGEELDVVLGIQGWRHARFRLFGSAFRPGSAFGAPPRDLLYGGRAQVQVVF